MKLHLSHAAGIHLITAYSDTSISINQVPYTHSLILAPQEWRRWPVTHAGELTAAALHPLLTFVPDFQLELVLLGTGRRQHFPSPEVLAPLINAGIGVEVMALAPACRTYNFLAAEGRRVAAALIIETGTADA